MLARVKPIIHSGYLQRFEYSDGCTTLSALGAMYGYSVSKVMEVCICLQCHFQHSSMTGLSFKTVTVQHLLCGTMLYNIMLHCCLWKQQPAASSDDPGCCRTSDKPGRLCRLNWKEAKSSSLVKAGDIISCAGKGRCEVKAVEVTKKERYAVQILRYV